MIFRELRIWSSLDHPNVLPLLGYVMYGDYPALVSRWMVNGSLRNYIEMFPDTSVIRMVRGSSIIFLVLVPYSLLIKARGTANGLLYLHNQDIIHSDMKSVIFFHLQKHDYVLKLKHNPFEIDNILVSDSGEPLLADFGVSRCMTISSTTTEVKAPYGGWLSNSFRQPWTKQQRSVSTQSRLMSGHMGWSYMHVTSSFMAQRKGLNLSMFPPPPSLFLGDVDWGTPFLEREERFCRPSSDYWR